METSSKTLKLVVPEQMVPKSIAIGLAPPTLPTAEVLYEEALELANNGLFELGYAQKLDVTNRDTYKDALDLAATLKRNAKGLEEARKARTEITDEWKKNVKAMYDAPIAVYKLAVTHCETLAMDFNRREAERVRKEQERLDRERQEREEKAAAEKREREAAEDRRQAEAAERIRLAQEKAKLEADQAGHELTADMQANAAAEEQRAREEKEKAERDEAARKADEEKQAELERQEREDAARRSTLEQTKLKGAKETWTYDLVDPDKVVRQLCEPSPRRMKAAVDSGLRQGDPNAAGLRIYKKMSLTGRGGGPR